MWLVAVATGGVGLARADDDAADGDADGLRAAVARKACQGGAANAGSERGKTG